MGNCKLLVLGQRVWGGLVQWWLWAWGGAGAFQRRSEEAAF